MDAFWTQTLSNVLATIIGGLLVAMVPLRTRAARFSTPPKISARNARGGTQVIFAEQNVGDVRVEVDNSRAIVVQNIQRSAPQPATTDQSATDTSVWWAVAGAVLAAGLFTWYHQLFFWLTVGIVVGLVATLVLAIVRAIRHRLWNIRATGVVIEVALSIASAIWAWVGVATITWRGSSIGTLSSRVSKAIADQETGDGPLDVLLKVTLSPGIQLVKLGLADQTVMLALTLMGAVVLSSLALLWSWVSLFDWLAYLGFIYGTSESPRLAKGAYRFDRRNWQGVIGHVIVCALAILFATGLLLTLMDATLPGGEFSIPVSG